MKASIVMVAIGATLVSSFALAKSPIDRPIERPVDRPVDRPEDSRGVARGGTSDHSGTAARQALDSVRGRSAVERVVERTRSTDIAHRITPADRQDPRMPHGQAQPTLVKPKSSGKGEELGVESKVANKDDANARVSGARKVDEKETKVVRLTQLGHELKVNQSTAVRGFERRRVATDGQSTEPVDAMSKTIQSITPMYKQMEKQKAAAVEGAKTQLQNLGKTLTGLGKADEQRAAAVTAPVAVKTTLEIAKFDLSVRLDTSSLSSYKGYAPSQDVKLMLVKE
jgi:hypothetical protein